MALCICNALVCIVMALVLCGVRCHSSKAIISSICATVFIVLLVWLSGEDALLRTLCSILGSSPTVGTILPQANSQLSCPSFRGR